MPRQFLPDTPQGLAETLASQLEALVLADLTPHPRNDGQHPPEEIEHLKQSLMEHGVYRNVVVARDGTILAGHGVIQAARELGHQTIPGLRKDYAPDDPRALRLLAGDNHIQRLRQQDDVVLLSLLDDLARDNPLGLLGTGFDDAALGALADAQQVLMTQGPAANDGLGKTPSVRDQDVQGQSVYCPKCGFEFTYDS